MSQSLLLVRRLYQQTALAHFINARTRLWALLWERQAGKSSTLADFALYEMFNFKNRTVIYGSASLLLAQEITLKTAIRANHTASDLIETDAITLKRFADTAQSIIDIQCRSASSSSPFASLLNQLHAARQTEKRDVDLLDDECQSRWPASADTSAFTPYLPVDLTAPNVEFKTFDTLRDREIKKYTAADFAELFRQQRLEFRVYHDRTSYSRTKVIAPNIATARSWSGTVLLDEVAFIRNFRELITALLPVISTDKNFKLILSTTPPEFDDTHYSFELLAPPSGATFKPDASGNWYTSESGIYVHRADAFDTALAGKKIFDLKTGDEICPVEALDRAPNKDGHRIAHWLTWMLGGSAACDLNRLKTAQERGSGSCQNFQISTDADMIPALNWLYQNLGVASVPASLYGNPGGVRDISSGSSEATTPGIQTQNTKHYPAGDARALSPSASRSAMHYSHIKIGIGFDVATTTKGKSNPSVVSIMEEHGPQWLVRARFIWKTRDPETANQRLHSILDVLERRGLRPRALAQDATNERYYAEQNRKHFRKRLPVILVVASEAVEKPGLDKPTNWKEYLGNQLIAKLDDNNLTLPPDDYTRTDYRLIMKDRGKFVCEPNDQGMHGDCFDADKLAGHALTASSSNRTIVAPVQSQILNPKFQMPHLL